MRKSGDKLIKTVRGLFQAFLSNYFSFLGYFLNIQILFYISFLQTGYKMDKPRPDSVSHIG